MASKTHIVEVKYSYQFLFLFSRLYLKDHKKKLTLTPDDPVTKVPLYEHLNTPSNGLCDDESQLCVQVYLTNIIIAKRFSITFACLIMVRAM